MKSINVTEMPRRMNELWKWVAALDAWDYCDASLICSLIENNDIPEEFKSPISDILSGKRKQKKKAAAKLKIPASERMILAYHVSAVIGIANDIRYSTLDPSDLTVTPGAVSVGNYKAIEPIEIIKDLELASRDAIKEGANQANTSTETIENLLRDLRNKINSWPDLSWP
jgi:hypothetical protein